MQVCSDSGLFPDFAALGTWRDLLPAVTPSAIPRALDSRWVILSEADADLTRVTIGSNFASAVTNLGLRIVLHMLPGERHGKDEKARASAISAHWKTQLGSRDMWGNLVHVLTPAAMRDREFWYGIGPRFYAGEAALSAELEASARNAAYMYAIEHGAKSMIDVAVLLAAGVESTDYSLEVDLTTAWPVLLPEALAGGMQTTLHSGVSGSVASLVKGCVDPAACAQADAATTLPFVRPTLLLHDVNSARGIGKLTVTASGTYALPVPPVSEAVVHMRVVEHDALFALFVPDAPSDELYAPARCLTCLI